jgi:hypothetical protein
MERALHSARIAVKPAFEVIEYRTDDCRFCGGSLIHVHDHPRSRVIILRNTTRPIDQGAEMRAAVMSTTKGFATYSEGMTLDANNAHPWDLGACRRR